MERGLQVTVVGEVLKSGGWRILALNRPLSKYSRLAKGYMRFNSTPNGFLYDNGYGEAKPPFNLNATLIRTARDKLVETLKPSSENINIGGLKLKRTPIRFDAGYYTFSKTTNVPMPYCFTLSLNGKEGFHSIPHRKLKTSMQYEANFEGIEVRHEAEGNSRAFHKCGHVAQGLNGSLGCLEFGLFYLRDLSGAVDIARLLMGGLGWRSREPPEPANEGEKPQHNVKSSRLQSWSDLHFEINGLSGASIE